MKVADALLDERIELMYVPCRFDIYKELLARVSSTGLVYLEHNRYNVTAEQANGVVSLRIFPEHITLKIHGSLFARQQLSFEAGGIT